jgi:hypothetical protein
MTVWLIRRTISFACAAALTGAGAYLLLDLLIYSEGGSGLLRIGFVSIIMACLGGYWLWVDFIDATPNRDG